MQFKLCYKSYDYKSSLAAMKEFKEATGLDLWATLMRYAGVFTKSQKDGLSLDLTLEKLAKVIDFVDSAQLFYCLAKQSSSVTIDEIEDGMFHVGMLKTERPGDMGEPYTFVLYQVALSVYEYHQQLAKDTKKP